MKRRIPRSRRFNVSDAARSTDKRCGDETVARPETGELLERRFEVEGSVIELLTEVDVQGETLHLRDIAIFPTGTERETVGAAAVLRVLRRELLPEMRAFGVRTLRITGTRLSGARPGRTVDLTIEFPEGSQ